MNGVSASPSFLSACLPASFQEPEVHHRSGTCVPGGKAQQAFSIHSPLVRDVSVQMDTSRHCGMIPACCFPLAWVGRGVIHPSSPYSSNIPVWAGLRGEKQSQPCDLLGF